MHKKTNLIQLSLCYYYKYKVKENNSLYILMSFLPTQLFKRNIKLYHLSSLLRFQIKNLFDLLFKICFVKRSSNYPSINVFYYKCPWNDMFNCFSHKIFFTPICSKTFCNFFLYLLIVTSSQLKDLFHYFLYQSQHMHLTLDQQASF